MWYIRWQITRGLVWLAFFIAPRSAARDLFLDALNKASRHVMETISAAKQ